MSQPFINFVLKIFILNIFVILTSSLLVIPPVNIVYYQPEQIHIAFGDGVNYDLSITWSTFNYTNQSIVHYGLDLKNLNSVKYGSSKLFVDGGPEKHSQYIHRVYLKNLLPNTQYVYRCGSDLGWSGLFRFTTTPNGTDWSPRFVIYGDLGNEISVSLPLLQQYAQSGYMNGVVHLGDYAYNWEDDNGRSGDAFMNQLQSIAAYVPYMAVVGNHEQAYNFSHYRERFTMPGNTDNFYYSFNKGPIHFIVISTEHFYFEELSPNLMKYQYEWLINDLNQAQKERDIRPWIIILGHRPMYCTNMGNEGCVNYETAVRTGELNKTTEYALEPLFYKYKVDLAMWGHEHSYVRFWPLYNFEVLNGTNNSDAFHNPLAPIHVITGAAGCKYPESIVPKADIYAYRTIDYGFTVLQAFNKTHLYFEQVSAINGTKQDSAWIIKDSPSIEYTKSISLQL
ncbi:acid phosphatase type 7-like isoform X2 [Chrysoperla carnea]|uniref:acid phosphatase type 7-like isoform X2 n=1 Tax=Chrysoperla carnea TaxID=189513 RepID=UPI001D07074C|nr:acid phosphatase type 7-like isoform X2 [Chrysoperla carnea]